MFKTLLATLMLSSSFGTPLIKTTPRMAVEQSSTQINGYYNLRDEMDWPNQYGTFDIVKSTDNIDCYFFYSDLSMYYKVSSMSFTYSFQTAPNYTMKVDVSYYDWYEEEEVTTSFNSGGTNGDFTSLVNYNNNFKELILYFPSTFYYTESRDNAFFYFFTSFNNAYITSYNGYYNFVLQYGGDSIDVRGNFIIDNKIYFELWDVDSGDLYANYYSYEGTEQVTKMRRIFSSNNAPKNRNVYFNIPKLPNSQKSKFEQFGVFSYVQPPTEQYTFSEFFFSIIDSPVYYLTQLFNFDVFGLNMFVAFASMITLCLIIIILKKVI